MSNIDNTTFEQSVYTVEFLHRQLENEREKRELLENRVVRLENLITQHSILEQLGRSSTTTITHVSSINTPWIPNSNCCQM